jgi:hypothetical protein
VEVTVKLDEATLKQLIMNWLKEQAHGDLAEPKIEFYLHGSGTAHPTYGATVTLAEPNPFIQGPYR